MIKSSYSKDEINSLLEGRKDLDKIVKRYVLERLKVDILFSSEVPEHDKIRYCDFYKIKYIDDFVEVQLEIPGGCGCCGPHLASVEFPLDELSKDLNVRMEELKIESRKLEEERLEQQKKLEEEANDKIKQREMATLKELQAKWGDEV